MHQWLCGVSVCAALGGTALGQGALTPTILGGGDSLVLPGEVVEVGFALTGNAAHNSAIFRVEWSAAVVELLSVQWVEPYATGGLFDDSVPSAVSLPVMVTEGLLSGFGYPAGAADIELSNVVPVGGGNFTSGEVARLRFRVNADVGVDRFLLSVSPDTFARGATVVEVEAGPSILFVVVPGPGTGVAGAVMAGVVAGRRRRSHG